MHNAAREAIDLIEVVASDTKLHRSARQEARRLVPLAASQPELVEVRLEDLRRRVVTGLPPGRFVQWSSDDVVGERIDEDIPFHALGDLVWRP